MADAMVALANLTLGSAQATVTFASIPATYRDLRVVVQGSMSGAGALFGRINGSTSGYTYAVAEANGSTARATSSSDATMNFCGNYDIFTNTALTTVTLDFLDYSATDKNKNVLFRGSSASQTVSMALNRWASNSAVTSFTLYSYGGTNWAAGSTFAIYGVSS